ncbi:hypothetical protein [Denitrobaculum tricleocarpae]|uniref:Fibronectin type III domain-containing protein n=1 Tax=Denitrobaculum tricleocarpae TaxID=2591009 RepID=A0A545TMN4_9PROT|nr:hypothetical protein [Denitrobaculum tricleocarpae]TQV78490.1 hypothetical protein FKG95_18180 [Denitrobaculum tricleocarpae]
MAIQSCKSLIARGLLLAAACLPAFAPPASADILDVTPTPTNAQVTVPAGSTAIAVTWRVRRDVLSASPTVTVRSTRGEFLIGRTVVATNATLLSRLSDPAGQIFPIETFTETVRVPASVAFQMAQNPDLVPIYRRSFDDGFAATAGAVRLVPATSTASEFDVRRLDLFFEDRSRVKVLPAGERLVALADVNFDGAGIAEFEWQIADPSSTRGALVFRRLQVFRRSLAGRGRVTLQSPELPTSAQGLHIVRLVATDPQLRFAPPELKYFVVPRKDATAAPAGQNIVLTGPPEGTQLSTETEFSWQDTPGAAVYQLEIYPIRPDRPVPPGQVQPIGGALLIDPDELSSRPITGIVLPSDQNSTSLKVYSLAHLEAGRPYLWRVKAISGNGAVIGTSPVRRIVAGR